MRLTSNRPASHRIQPESSENGNLVQNEPYRTLSAPAVSEIERRAEPRALLDQGDSPEDTRQRLRHASVSHPEKEGESTDSEQVTTSAVGALHGTKRKSAAVEPRSESHDSGQQTGDKPGPSITDRPSPSKKQKTTTAEPDAANVRVDHDLVPDPRRTGRNLRTSVRARGGVITSESLLQSAADQAAIVSSIANTIERDSLPIHPTAVHSLNHDNTVGQEQRSVKRPRRRKTLQDVAADIVAEAAGERRADKGGRNNRKPTPDGAEEQEIEPTTVKMGELCADSRVGKLSSTELAMRQIDWKAVRDQRREEAEEAAKRRREAKEQKKNGGRKDEILTQPLVPKMIEVNGVIMVEEASRTIDTQAAAVRAAADESVRIIEDKSITRRVNSATVGRQSGVGRGFKWDEEMTERFYRGLRMFGTDFMMVSHMFPGMSRRHIKLKFVREERENPARVNENLRNREGVDLHELERLTEKTFDDPQKVHREMEAEEQRLRLEAEQRQAQEALQAADDFDADVPLPSRETVEPSAEDARGEALGVEEERNPSAQEDRFGSVADQIVEAAGAPKKTKKRKQQQAPRKRHGPAEKTKGSKRGKKAIEGVEERLGPIDEVTR